MDKAVIELLARRAGLDKALAEFPEDVAAAAEAARRPVVSELHWLTAVEAAKAIAAREVSPVELMTALLERIDRLDPKLNVFIQLDGEAAMGGARAAEAETA